mmetsp:Transcript_44760/g.102000  ORF Transcript_44760/g.102000 Transcript_44760/m.102000 type:complete len:235 (-) Transcript_44760:24-728(-)
MTRRQGHPRGQGVLEHIAGGTLFLEARHVVPQLVDVVRHVQKVRDLTRQFRHPRGWRPRVERGRSFVGEVNLLPCVGAHQRDDPRERVRRMLEFAHVVVVVVGVVVGVADRRVAEKPERHAIVGGERNVRRREVHCHPEPHGAEARAHSILFEDGPQLLLDPTPTASSLVVHRQRALPTALLLAEYDPKPVSPVQGERLGRALHHLGLTVPHDAPLCLKFRSRLPARLLAAVPS